MTITLLFLRQTLNSYSANYAENGTGNVATVVAADADGTSCTYSLSGTDAADFNSNSSSGVITFASADYENPADGGNNVYNFLHYQRDFIWS